MDRNDGPDRIHFANSKASANLAAMGRWTTVAVSVCGMLVAGAAVAVIQYEHANSVLVASLVSESKELVPPENEVRDIGNRADWAQVQTGLAANQLARDAVRVAWASTFINAGVVIAAFLVPWLEHRRSSRSVEEARRGKTTEARDVCAGGALEVIGLYAAVLADSFERTFGWLPYRFRVGGRNVAFDAAVSQRAIELQMEGGQLEPALIFDLAEVHLALDRVRAVASDLEGGAKVRVDLDLNLAELRFRAFALVEKYCAEERTEHTRCLRVATELMEYCVSLEGEFARRDLTDPDRMAATEAALREALGIEE